MADVFADDIGTRITRTVQEVDATGALVAVDVSGAANVYFYLTDPTGATAQVAGSLKTDGTDGKVTFKRATAWAVPGTWEGYVRLVWDASNDFNSTPFDFTVKPDRRP